ncbi:MAG: hypothetical protein ACE5JS_22755, partial [Nitrospinota bacterium]
GTRTELPGTVTLSQDQEVLAGAEFPRIPFSGPAGTEPCMAVYAGKLGDEADAVIGKVFVPGDFQIVTADLDDNTFEPFLILTSLTQGDFLLPLAQFGVPIRVNLGAKFVQNDPSKVMVAWREFIVGAFGQRRAIAKWRFKILKISNNKDGGKINRAEGDPITIGAFEIGELVTGQPMAAVLLEEFEIAENELLGRTINLNLTAKRETGFIQFDLADTGCTHPTQLFSPVFRCPFIAVTVFNGDQSFVETFVRSASITMVPRFPFDINDLWAVDVEGEVRVFMLSNQERKITNAFGVEGDPNDTLTLNVREFSVDTSAGPVTATPVIPDIPDGPIVSKVVSRDFPIRQWAEMTKDGRTVIDAVARVALLYLIDVKNKSIIFRNTETEQTITWTKFFPFSTIFVRFLPSTGAFLNFDLIATATPKDTTQAPKLHQNLVELLTPPNPFNQEPWFTEANDRNAVNEEFFEFFVALLKTPFGLSLGQSFVPFPAISFGEEKRIPNSSTDTLDRFTTAAIPSQDMLGLTENNEPRPVILRGPADLTQTKLSEWDGFSLTDFLDGVTIIDSSILRVRALKLSERWILTQEFLSLSPFTFTFRLFDRKKKTLHSLSPNTESTFDPTRIAISEGRLFFAPDAGTGTPGLLRVTIDNQNEAVFERTGELLPTSQTFPSVSIRDLDDKRGRTGAVFPQKLNDTGNPTP